MHRYRAALAACCLAVAFLSTVMNANPAKATGVSVPDVKEYPHPHTASDDWKRHAVIYELFVRNFTPEGTFEAVIPRLPELRDLGVTVIWLMPIHPIGEEKRKGTYGSPYSIRDFYDVDPNMGTKEDFRALVDAVHENGMRIILDMVANHTAWDNDWVRENPHWYVHDEAGEIVPPVEDWWDVADLNYDEPEVRREMINVLRYWVEEMNVDGYRCDVAEMVPLDFWEDAIAELREIKPVMMLAEGEKPELYDHGFDLTYSFRTYHKLVKDVWTGDPAGDYVAELLDEIREMPPDGIKMRFTTNHDETAWDRTAIEKYNGITGAQAAAVLVSTVPGVPLVYNGQEVAENVRYGLFERTPIDWSLHPEMRDFYRQLFEARAGSRALLDGDIEFIEHSAPDDVLVFRRQSGDDVAVTIVNVRNAEVDLSLPATLDVSGLQNAFGEPFFGPSVTLGPYAYYLLTNQTPGAGSPPNE